MWSPRSRAREAQQAELQQAEIKVRVAELAAEADQLRLARLEDQLQRYPHAASWEWADTQLNVARALAGNSRVVLQLGEPGDLARLLTLRDIANGSVPLAHDGSTADGDA